MTAELDGRRQRTVLSRQQILDSAERLFATTGFRSTSLRSIAAAIGMSHAGVLKHFATKDELLVAILDRLVAGSLQHAAGGHPDPRAYIRGVAEYTFARPGLMALTIVMLGEATDAGHPAHGYVARRLQGVESVMSPVFGADRSVDILAVWNGLQLLWLYLPDRMHPVRELDRAIDTLLQPEMPRIPATVNATTKHGADAAAADQEARIVAAATAAFAEKGYRGTTLREIAATLGLSHSSVLYHFPSKVVLLAAVLDERDRDKTLPWTFGSGPIDYLYGMYLQALFNAQHPGLSRLFSTLVCEATDPGHPAHPYFARRFERFHAELRGVLAELVTAGVARPDVDPDCAAYMLIALWDGLGPRESYQPDAIGLPERLRRAINSLLTVEIPAGPPAD